MTIPVCALFGVPRWAKLSGTQTFWVCVLFGSFINARLGWLFIPLWQRALDEFSSEKPTALLLDESADHLPPAHIAKHKWISTTLHIVLHEAYRYCLALVLILFILGFHLTFASYIVNGVVVSVGLVVLISFSELFLLIPARCPNCSGRTYCRDTNPVTFVCLNCNHIHKAMWNIDDD